MKEESGVTFPDEEDKVFGQKAPCRSRCEHLISVTLKYTVHFVMKDSHQQNLMVEILQPT